jgi:ketosteroid isomerase-like protein
MISAIALRIIGRASRQLAAGDIRPLLRTYRIDAIDTFPGQSSWAGVYRGREEIGGFLRRFVDVGLKLQPVDVVAKGWPWNMTVCVLFTDHLTTPEGERVYQNRGVLYLRMRWGKVVSQETFLDTQRVAKLDEWLAARADPDSLPS